MSLFEDKNYQYRETYFLLLNKDSLPGVEEIQTALGQLGPKYETINVRQSGDKFESLTVRSPYDFSAMDITYVEGEDVISQIGEMMEELRTTTLTGDDHLKIKKLAGANARFEIYHFEQVGDAATEDEFLDPGGLLIVLEKLCELCDGVGVDPQSNSLV